MTYLIYIITLLTCLTGCTAYRVDVIDVPALTSVHIIDRNGFSETINNFERLQQFETTDFLKEQPYEKVMRTYARDLNGEIRAYITSYFPNGQPHQYLEVVNNRANGVYKEWYSNGVLKLETFVIGGDADITTAAEKTWLFDGCSQVWNEEGQLIAEIPYLNGALEGTSIYYHPNGKRWKVFPYHQNGLDGTVELYLDNGLLLQHSHYINNVKHGPSERFWTASQLAAQEEFAQGKLLAGRYFNPSGEQIACIDNGDGYRAIFGKSSVQELQQYKNGLQEGEVTVFGAQGEIVNRYGVKNSVKHGEEVVYYPTKSHKLLPQLSIHWVDGKMQGLVKSWYPNGIQENQREINNNKKNGLLTAWYKDGSVMLIEEYDNDKLMEGRYYIKGEMEPVSEIREGKGTATFHTPEGEFLNKVKYVNHKPAE